MSAKAVSNDIRAIVNQKRNRLYDIFVMKIAFSSFYFVFRVFLLTFDLFKSVAFQWCVCGMGYSSSSNFVVIFQKYSEIRIL